MRKIVYLLLLIVPLSLFSATMNKNGMVVKESQNNVSKTIELLTTVAQKNGVEGFTIIDHKKNAFLRSSINIKENKLIIFSEANISVGLLKSDPAIGLDLPLKVLVYMDQDSKVYIKYRDPRFFKNIYNIGDAKEAIIMSQMIDEFTNFSLK